MNQGRWGFVTSSPAIYSSGTGCVSDVWMLCSCPGCQSSWGLKTHSFQSAHTKCFWATICLIFKSPSATFPGQPRTSPASFAARWASLHLLLTEMPWRTGYLLPACELRLLLTCSILELKAEANSLQNSSARASQCGRPGGESRSLGSDLPQTLCVLEKYPALT